MMFTLLRSYPDPAADRMRHMYFCRECKLYCCLFDGDDPKRYMPKCDCDYRAEFANLEKHRGTKLSNLEKRHLMCHVGLPVESPVWGKIIKIDRLTHMCTVQADPDGRDAGVPDVEAHVEDVLLQGPSALWLETLRS